MFYKKGVLVNFAKFTGKYLCQSLFFNKTDAQHSHSYFRRTLSKTITNVYLTDWIFSYLSEAKRKSKFRRNSFYRRKVAFYKDLTRSRNSFHGKNSQKNTYARPATLLKKILWHRCFPVNFEKFLKHFLYRAPRMAAFVITWITGDCLSIRIHTLGELCLKLSLTCSQQTGSFLISQRLKGNLNLVRIAFTDKMLHFIRIWPEAEIVFRRCFQSCLYNFGPRPDAAVKFASTSQKDKYSKVSRHGVTT